MEEKNKYINPEYVRNVPGWPDAPVPICHGGDIRALTFCCKPGYSLTFGPVCLRDKALNDAGISKEEFVKIKDNFSKKMNWDTSLVCFGSLSYCCLRKNGCPSGRDYAIAELYKNERKDQNSAFAEYFKRKRLLAIELMKAAKNKKLVKPYLEKEENETKDMNI